MVVVVTNEQVFNAQRVCQGCLLANHQGLPRWQQGSPCCSLALPAEISGQGQIYQCPMGFRLANIPH